MLIIIIYTVIMIIPFGSLLAMYSLNKYKNTKCKRKLTGCEAAHEILDSRKLDNVYVVNNRRGINSYDSSRKVIKLADDVFDENTIYGLTIGALKAIEATEDKKTNKIMYFRDSTKKVVYYGTMLSYALFIIGNLFNIYEASVFSLALLIFAIIYNYVMINKEREYIEKTVKCLKSEGFIDKDEKSDIELILNIYKFNYFSDMITSIKNIIEFIIPEE